MTVKSFNIKIFLSAIIILAILGISCKKYIYQGPITATYNKKFWTSQTSVEQAALAMYGQLRADFRATDGYTNGGSYFIQGDLPSGDFVPMADAWNLQTLTGNGGNNSFNFSYVPYFEPALQDWSRYYQLIAQANLILQNVPQMNVSLFQSPAVRNSYIAEALFMRAYTYFYLVRNWGDPVFVTKSYNDVDYGNIPAVPRTPESTVLDSCLNDLRIAASNLSYAGGDPTKSVRANKGSAYALMAHIFAWQHQYDSVHHYCQQIINNGGYSLEPMASYKNIWNGQSSQESIFELAMTYNPNDPNFKNGSNWAEANFSFFASFVKGTINSTATGNPFVTNINTCFIAPLGGIIDQNLDTTNDARYKAVFQLVPATNGDPAGYELLKYTNFAYQQPGPTPATSQYPYVNNDLVIFRLSDIYLLDAEALAVKNNLVGAANDLSFTENRAGITTYQNPTTQVDMMNEIVAERGRELIGEGQWFYDFIRTNNFFLNNNGGFNGTWFSYVGYSPAQRTDSVNKGYYWPLNMTALFPYDNLLTQNPWWAVHSGH